MIQIKLFRFAFPFTRGWHFFSRKFSSEFSFFFSSPCVCESRDEHNFHFTERKTMCNWGGQNRTKTVRTKGKLSPLAWLVVLVRPGLWMEARERAKAPLLRWKFSRSESFSRGGRRTRTCATPPLVSNLISVGFVQVSLSRAFPPLVFRNWVLKRKFKHLSLVGAIGDALENWISLKRLRFNSIPSRIALEAYLARKVLPSSLPTEFLICRA